MIMLATCASTSCSSFTSSPDACTAAPSDAMASRLTSRQQVVLLGDRGSLARRHVQP